MPAYEYICTKCGTVVEMKMTMDEYNDFIDEGDGFGCEECGASLRRHYGTPPGVSVN